MTPNNIRENSTLLSDPQMGEMLSQLSAAELKVLLYLTIRKGASPLASKSASGTEADLPVRKIADGTHLSKKEVRNALRLLSISTSYFHRFH